MKPGVSKKIIPYALVGFILIATVVFMIFVGSKNPTATIEANKKAASDEEIRSLPDATQDQARQQISSTEKTLRDEREREAIAAAEAIREAKTRDEMRAKDRVTADEEAARVALALGVGQLPRSPQAQLPRTDPGMSSRIEGVMQDATGASTKIEAYESYDNTDENGKQKVAERSSSAASDSRAEEKKPRPQKTSSATEVKNQPPLKATNPNLPVTEKYLLSEGDVIRTVFVTGVSSKNPGKVIVRVTEDVYDSIGGKNLLIPKGTRITGNYSGEIKTGQDRMPMSFDRLMMPDGRSVKLPKMPAVARTGETGADGEYHSNLLPAIMPALIVGLFGSALDYIMTKDAPAVATNMTGVGTQSAGAGQSVARQVFPEIQKRLSERYEGSKPFFTIEAGQPFMIMVTADFAIPPGESTAVLRSEM